MPARPRSESATQKTKSLCSEGENDGHRELSAARRGPFAVACGRANLLDHGAACGAQRRRHVGYALLGHAKWIAAKRNGPDVSADERLSFDALAEADLTQQGRPP